MENNEVRKLPKFTIAIILFIVFITSITFYELKSLKEQKMAEILFSIGHTNIKDVMVINKLEVEDKDTRVKSYIWKIKFFDSDLNQTCVGFVHKEKDKTYKKDFDCK